MYKTSATAVNVYEVDTSIKEGLEKSARNGVSFEEALKENGLTMDSVRDIVQERMFSELEEFMTIMREIHAERDISPAITDGLKTEKELETTDTEIAMDYYNLKYGETDFNLAQIFFNDWLQTKGINYVLLGDQVWLIR